MDEDELPPRVWTGSCSGGATNLPAANFEIQKKGGSEPNTLYYQHLFHTQYLSDVTSDAARLIIGLTHHAVNDDNFVIHVPHVATYSTRIRILFQFFDVNNFDWTNSIISVIEINQF